MARLRFGIMCRGLRLPAWQAACIRALAADGLAAPALLIVDNDPPTRAGRLRRFVGRPERLLFNLYNHLLVRPLVAPFREQDLDDLLGHLPIVACSVVTRGSSQFFEDEDLRAIRRYRLDFVLRFAFNVIRGEILEVARYGVWSFHHGDERAFRGSPAGFWELFHDRPDTGVILQRLSERLDNGTVLRRGNFRSAITWAGSLARIYGQAAAWPSDCVHRIAAGDTGFLTAAPELSTAPILRPPTNREFLRFVCRQSRRIAKRLARAVLFADDWNIGVAHWPRQALLQDRTTAGVAWATPPAPGLHLADPMVCEEQGADRVYAEQFDYRRPARIVSLAWPQDFATGAVRCELDTGSHLSYPFVLAHEGKVYMAPESRALRRLSLLRRTADGEWREFCRIADDVELTDPTLVRHAGRWWLFCCEQRGVMDTRLMIWHAPELGGPWQPHARNPVKLDVRSARPAGPLFEVAGTLYRPAQDCARSYGGAVAINRIEELSEQAFVESPVARLSAAPSGPYPDGVHTLVVGTDRVFVDGKRSRLRLGLLPQQLRRIRAERRAGARERLAGRVRLLPVGPAER